MGHGNGGARWVETCARTETGGNLLTSDFPLLRLMHPRHEQEEKHFLSSCFWSFDGVNYVGQFHVI